MDLGIGLLSLLLLCVASLNWGQRQCPRLQKPWNGRLIGSCDRHTSAQCLFECRDPYVLVGSRVRVCRGDGTWSGITTACELTAHCDNCCKDCVDAPNCPSLPDPSYGYREGQCDPGVVGQTCLFRCLAGYTLEGQSRLTCLSGGRWNAGAPICRRSSTPVCESLTIQHGYARCSLEGGLTVCHVTCEEGYVLVGSTIVTCTAGGRWNEQIPHCRRSVIEVTSLCPPLVPPPGGRLLGSCTSGSTGDTCQLVCLSGYRPTDTRVLVCQPDGRWSDELPRCIAHSCPTLPAPASGFVSGSCGPATAGQTCQFICNPGYRLVGTNTLVCGADGRWNANAPYCVGDTCVPLQPPSNGGQSGQCQRATAGETCSFFCHPGYTLSGSAILQCQPGGQWSGHPPTCTPTTATTCPNLFAPNNGILIGACAPARVGETCAFTCDEGYRLIGQRSLTCLPDGQWSGGQPYCRRDTDGDSTCPPLTPPPHGAFLECDPRPGGRCVVACESGFIRSGSRVRTCLQSGVWTGFAPTCTRKGCCD